jgi:hypothetical protein
MELEVAKPVGGVIEAGRILGTGGGKAGWAARFGLGWLKTIPAVSGDLKRLVNESP